MAGILTDGVNLNNSGWDPFATIGGGVQYNMSERVALRGAMAGPAGGLMSWVLRPLSGGRFLVSFADAMPAAAAPRAAQGEDVSSLRPDDLSVQRATG